MAEVSVSWRAWLAYIKIQIHVVNSESMDKIILYCMLAQLSLTHFSHPSCAVPRRQKVCLFERGVFVASALLTFSIFFTLFDRKLIWNILFFPPLRVPTYEITTTCMYSYMLEVGKVS